MTSLITDGDYFSFYELMEIIFVRRTICQCLIKSISYVIHPPTTINRCTKLSWINILMIYVIKITHCKLYTFIFRPFHKSTDDNVKTAFTELHNNKINCWMISRHLHINIKESMLKITRRKCRQVSNIRRTLVDNKIVDHSDVVGAAPAPTTSSFST